MNIKIIVSFLLLTLATACSNRDVYNNIQNNKRLYCQSLPDSERQTCFASVKTSYTEYERQRQLLKKKD